MSALPIALLFKYLLLLFSASLLANLSIPFASHDGIYEAYLKPQTDSVMIENWSFMILFESNKHITDTFSDQKFEELKNILDQYPAFSIRLEARTDSVGSPQYNLSLANRRLNFVRNEFIKRRIEEDRFIEYVLGEEEPLADNNSPEGRQANRSVRVVVGLYSPIQIIRGRFVSEQEDRGLEGVLYTGTRYNRDTIMIDSIGHFTFPVHQGAIFFMEFFSKDHIMGRTYFNLSRVNPVIGNIPLQILQGGSIFSFEDILFVGHQAVVLPEFRPSLLRLLQMIQLASDYRFEIQSHVNYPFGIMRQKGTFEYEMAEARAKKIYNFLIENGIDSNRLEWKGYSNWRMAFPDPQTETQARQNRRLSVKVLGRIDD